jgi:hypothetical protein
MGDTARMSFQTAEQCETFQMMAFGISCTTCERSDEECPWGRRYETTTGEPDTSVVSVAAATA